MLLVLYQAIALMGLRFWLLALYSSKGDLFKGLTFAETLLELWRRAYGLWAEGRQVELHVWNVAGRVLNERREPHSETRKYAGKVVCSTLMDCCLDSVAYADQVPFIFKDSVGHSHTGIPEFLSYQVVRAMQDVCYQWFPTYLSAQKMPSCAGTRKGLPLSRLPQHCRQRSFGSHVAISGIAVI